MISINKTVIILFLLLHSSLYIAAQERDSSCSKFSYKDDTNLISVFCIYSSNKITTCWQEKFYLVWKHEQSCLLLTTSKKNRKKNEPFKDVKETKFIIPLSDTTVIESLMELIKLMEADSSFYCYGQDIHFNYKNKFPDSKLGIDILYLNESITDKRIISQYINLKENKRKYNRSKRKLKILGKKSYKELKLLKKKAVKGNYLSKSYNSI